MESRKKKDQQDLNLSSKSVFNRRLNHSIVSSLKESLFCFRPLLWDIAITKVKDREDKFDENEQIETDKNLLFVGGRESVRNRRKESNI